MSQLPPPGVLTWQSDVPADAAKPYAVSVVEGRSVNVHRYALKSERDARADAERLRLGLARVGTPSKRRVK